MAKANKAADKAADIQQENPEHGQTSSIKSFAKTKIEGFVAHIMIPKLSHKKKQYTAEELVEQKNETVLKELWEQAWTDENDQRRDEEYFERNGIFKIEY